MKNALKTAVIGAAIFFLGMTWCIVMMPKLKITIPNMMQAVGLSIFLIAFFYILLQQLKKLIKNKLEKSPYSVSLLCFIITMAITATLVLSVMTVVDIFDPSRIQAEYEYFLFLIRALMVSPMYWVLTIIACTILLFMLINKFNKKGSELKAVK